MFHVKHRGTPSSCEPLFATMLRIAAVKRENTSSYPCAASHHSRKTGKTIVISLRREAAQKMGFQRDWSLWQEVREDSVLPAGFSRAAPLSRRSGGQRPPGGILKGSALEREA